MDNLDFDIVELFWLRFALGLAVLFIAFVVFFVN